MIEPTHEMIREFRRVALTQGEGISAGLTAVFAIVEQDQAAKAEEDPSARSVRVKLDAAIAEGLPFAGGRVRKRLKQLRRALAELDEERKRCTRPGCGHVKTWHVPDGCAGDLLHCQCKGWTP